MPSWHAPCCAPAHKVVKGTEPAAVLPPPWWDGAAESVRVVCGGCKIRPLCAGPTQHSSLWWQGVVLKARFKPGFHAVVFLVLSRVSEASSFVFCSSMSAAPVVVCVCVCAHPVFVAVSSGWLCVMPCCYPVLQVGSHCPYVSTFGCNTSRGPHLLAPAFSRKRDVLCLWRP